VLPDCLDQFIAEDNPMRVVDTFVEQLDLHDLDFHGTEPADTGRPSYHPAVQLKIYICGYLNRLQSSSRLERECRRNVGALLGSPAGSGLGANAGYCAVTAKMPFDGLLPLVASITATEPLVTVPPTTSPT
jgi:hypothetical protein